MTLLALASPLAALALSIAFLLGVRTHGRRRLAEAEHLAQAGDVDSNGDIIDELRERIERATGPVTEDVGRERHLDLVERLIEEARSS